MSVGWFFIPWGGEWRISVSVQHTRKDHCEYLLNHVFPPWEPPAEEVTIEESGCEERVQQPIEYSLLFATCAYSIGMKVRGRSDFPSVSRIAREIISCLAFDACLCFLDVLARQ